MSMSKYRFKGASAGLAGQSFALEQELWLGSDDGCEVVIKDDGVQARHVRVFVQQEQVLVENKASTQAELRVNGELATQQPLNSGDELRLASARLVFQAPGLRPSSVLREEAPASTPWGWIIGGAVVAAAAAAGAAYYLGYLNSFLQ